MSQPHILIVEDEVILFDRLSQALLKENFTVSDYTPSVTKALEAIDHNRPDVVLLDIHLKGKRSGLDLGKILTTEKDIPFIYVTKHEDNATFLKGLETKHDQYIVKTKPRLDLDQVIRAIHTTLSRKQQNNNNNSSTKKGILALTDYLDELKVNGPQSLSKIPIRYDDIAFFTVKAKYEDDPDKETEYIRANYLWLQTITGEQYYLKTSLRKLQRRLPEQFERINESYIVNLNPEILEGRVNGSRIVVAGRTLMIKDTYKEVVRAKIEAFYLG